MDTTYDSYGVAHDHMTAASGVGIAIMVAGYVGVLVFTIWNHIFRQGRTGASLGKKWVGIQVIGERTGQPIGALMTFVRQLVHLLDALACYIGYLWPLWDAKRQTFADKIMSTVVIPHKES